MVVVTEPCAELGSQMEQAEAARLASVKEALSEEEVQGLIQHTTQLRDLQETPDPPEALATVPCLKVSDVPPHSKTLPIHVEPRPNGAQVITHDIFTRSLMLLHPPPQGLWGCAGALWPLTVKRGASRWT